jgi:hypothetical protein
LTVVSNLSLLQQDEHQSGGIKRSPSHINDLKFKILRDKTYERSLTDFEPLPPYLRKRNRRFKSIHETMHENDWQRKKTPSYSYGHFEYLHKNELPEADLFAQVIKRTDHKHHHKKHQHLTHSHQKIKKYRSKPEVGIMQKKLKLVH